MSRQTFLTIASIIALLFGTFAVLFPGILLQSKGVEPVKATVIWVIEVGCLLIALGLIAFLCRKHDASPTMKVFLFGNIVIQLALAAIEIVAYFNNIITKLSGIIPNILIHIILAIGFIHFCWLVHSDLKQIQANKKFSKSK